MHWCKRWFVLLLLCLGACRASEQPSVTIQGRVLLWHAWTDQKATALTEALARFHAIHPDVVVKQQAFANADEMLGQFQVAAAAGLGPDLILAPSQWIPALRRAKLIDAIGDTLPGTTIERYLPGALTALQDGDSLYGVPVTVDTTVLYYDRRYVEQPATTLDALLAAAKGGQFVEMSTTFVDAFWGVPAFGGQLFDAEQRVILDRGGFANWLAWLKDARETPGMILDSNRAALLQRFITDGVAYYVGSTAEYGTILAGRTALTTTSATLTPAEQIGVALLPTGPNSSASPFLETQGLLFSTVSSPNQRDLALVLAQFITNAEQQTSLMRSAGIIPANRRVRLNPSLEPVVTTFVAQARTAVPLPNGTPLASIVRFGNDAYTQVLEGVADPATAAANATVAMNEANGFTAILSSKMACEASGTLYLGVALTGPIVERLQTMVADLRRSCPTMLVNIAPVTLDEAAARLRAPLAADGRLDFVLAPQSWLLPLAEQGVLADLTTQVDIATLQRYRPIAVAALRAQNQLYGLPLAMQIDALYVNRALVTEPAQTLDELRTQALTGVPITLDTDFLHGYWGFTAFGGQLFDSNEQLQLNAGPFADWLAWLKAARDSAGITIAPDHAAAEQRFLAGQSAYLVADPAFLHKAQEQLGADQIGVTLLPAGPGGEGQPLLSSSGFLFSRRLSAPTLTLALAFTNYVTSVENQATLLTDAGLLPTNAGVESSADATLRTFLEQAERAQPMPNVLPLPVVLELAGTAYTAVLAENVDPVQAVATVTAQINAQSAAEATPPAPKPTNAQPPSEEGQP